LPEATHQKGDECRQPRAGLTGRDASRQFRTSRLGAAAANESVALVFCDVRLDLRQFPDLMPQRRRIASAQTLTATTALARFERLNVVALLRGEQRPLVLGMARLTASFPFRLGLRGWRFGVRMLRTRRERRILGGPSETCFELGHALGERRHLRQQCPNNRLRFRRLSSNQFLSYFQRHAQDVAEIAFCAKSSF
jgi:hypothetical protein